MRIPPSSVFGSSPLARGTLSSTSTTAFTARLIPARAGNTNSAGSKPSRAAAHPRSRGEHEPCANVPVSLAGSSPLARGTQFKQMPTEYGLRLIPARAGNT